MVVGRGPQHAHGLHRREVDHQAAVTQRKAGVVVITAADGHLEALLLRDDQRGSDVAATRATGDHRGPPRDGVVPDVDRLVIAGLAGLRDLLADRRLQRLHRATRDVHADGRRVRRRTWVRDYWSALVPHAVGVG